MSRRTTTRRRLVASGAGLLALALVASACGGTKSGDAGNKTTLKSAGLTSKDGESGLKDAGDPVRGGTLTYGVEADSQAGYCLPEAQLAISGMMVVRAFYDTLTVPNAEGKYVPYLAKSVTPNDDYTEWTIGLRKGIKFHDGTDLDATVVKNNIDAYRGTYPTRKPLLFTFVLKDIDKTEVVDPMTVKVTTKRPWVAFPAFLYNSSRMGIMAQSQLDDTKTCASKLVGTGPWKFKSWDTNTSIKGTRNKDYWQTAPDGKPYPYADNIDIEFKPDGQVRANALRSGGINVEHTSDSELIGNTFRPLRDQGKVNMYVSEDFSEPAFLQLNSTKAPFDDIRMRKALALGTDRTDLNKVQNNGLPTVANGPFAPDSIGYVADPGFPDFDIEEAKKLVKEYVAEGKGHKAEFTLTLTQDPSTLRLAQEIQQRAAKAGVKVKLQQMDQAKLIDAAIGKKYEAMTFRNYSGGDPDINTVWWYGEGNPVNFGGYNDPVINKLLDEGRGEDDPAKRKQIYQDINREFAKQVWSIWSWYTPWAIVMDKSVHNVLGPPLPGDDTTKAGDATTDDPARQPNPGLATGHSLIGMWVAK